MNIRDFTPGDYQAVVDIQNAVYPDNPAVVEDWREADAQIDPKCKFRRWIAEVEGQAVGVAQYIQTPWGYHPQKFYVMVRVHPGFQGRGIGKALYAVVIAALEEFDPIQISATIREDHPYVQQWLAKLGYRLHVREQRSALVPAEFDPVPFAGVEEKLAAAGITIKTYEELSGDPDRDQKLYRMEMDILPDVPGNDEFTEPGLERYKQDVLDAPMRAVYLAAVTADGEVVGLTNLWADRASDMLFTGLTGVKRSHRRLGIATALKVRAILWAKARGCSRINTDNAETNPMLQLNYRLGFRPLPAFVIYRKVLREVEAVAEA